MNIKSTKRQKALGMFSVICGSLLFGLGYTFGDVIVAEGMSETCNGLWTAIFAILINALLGITRKKSPFRKIERKHLGLCLICGVLAMWLSNFMFLVAYQYMEVAEVTMLHFLYPSVITLFMTIIVHEKLTKKKIGAIISSIIGMLIITGGFRTGHPVGLAAALSTGILYSVYPVLLDTTSLHEVENSTIIMYINLFSGLTAFLVSVATNKFMLPVNATVLLCEISVAFTSVTGYTLTSYGIRAVGASNASFGSMLEPIAGCVFAALVLKQQLGLNVLIGAVFILMAIVCVSVHDLSANPQNTGCRNV